MFLWHCRDEIAYLQRTKGRHMWETIQYGLWILAFGMLTAVGLIITLFSARMILELMGW